MDAPTSQPPVVERALLLLDYDGTLAEIALDPDRALPYPRVPELLGALARRMPVRIVTGRRVADLARLLPVPGLEAIGVHGLEAGKLGEASDSLLDREAGDLLMAARAGLPAVTGVRVEDKGAAIALHYRGVDDEERVANELRAWCRSLPSGLEAVWGKKVVEVRPHGFDKGRAASELAAAFPDRTPVMIGDDTTDEDAFRALPQAVTVKVGGGETAARYRLSGVEAVVAYLEKYL